MTEREALERMLELLNENVRILEGLLAKERWNPEGGITSGSDTVLTLDPAVGHVDSLVDAPSYAPVEITFTNERFEYFNPPDEGDEP